MAERTNLAETKDQALRRVFSEIAESVGYRPYRTVGFAMFKLCRNGLAHGFYPNEVETANGPRASAMVSFWIDATTHRSVCVHEIGEHATSGHLIHRKLGADVVVLNVSAQHLYRDVHKYIESFLQQLRTDMTLQARVSANDERLLADATRRATEGLSGGDLIALGL